jgi:hypothetical protein
MAQPWRVSLPGLVCLCILVTSLPRLTHAQTFSAEIIGAAGGAAVRQAQCGGHVRVQPTSSPLLYITVGDGAGNGLADVMVQQLGFVAYPSDGGHIHSGGGYGSFRNTVSVTDGNGVASFRYDVGRGAQTVYPLFLFEWEGFVASAATCNALRIAEEDDDYDWLGNGPGYVLIGATGSHPLNQYGKPDFNARLRALAAAYNDHWGLTLAYNDGSLKWGGIFDLPNNYGNPHYEHNIGTSKDVRANGGAYSIPHDPAVRHWFEQLVVELFGQAPLLEGSGTGNEHYHIRG